MTRDAGDCLGLLPPPGGAGSGDGVTRDSDGGGGQPRPTVVGPVTGLQPIDAGEARA
jgi:hypothetical protein